MLYVVHTVRIFVGIGVGWQRRCKTCQSLRELDTQGTVFFFLLFVFPMMVIELGRVVWGGEP